MARSALINNPRYNPSRNGAHAKKNDPSERAERVIFVFAAVFLRPAGGFVKRLEQFRETPCSGHSVNSPASRHAAASAAAYMFSTASLHPATPTVSKPAPSPEPSSEAKTRTASRIETRHAPRKALRLVSRSGNPVSEPRTENRNAHRRARRPEPRLDKPPRTPCRKLVTEPRGETPTATFCTTLTASKTRSAYRLPPRGASRCPAGFVSELVAVFDPGAVSGTSSRFGVRHVSRSGCRHGSGVRSGDVERAA